jgi:hypothetical protein
MGKGEMIASSYNIEAYEQIHSGSILEAIWNIVCE